VAGLWLGWIPVVELVVALVDGWNDGGGERSCWNGGCGNWFFANFGPYFLLLQAIKPTSIYRQWKRVISSTQGKISAIDSVGRDPNHWFKVGMVHSQICRKVCLSWHV